MAVWSTWHKAPSPLTFPGRARTGKEAELIEALNEKRIWTAGLDVFEQEPVDAANPLLKIENVVVGPHLASNSHENYPRRVGFAFENMRRAWDSGKPESVVGV